MQVGGRGVNGTASPSLHHDTERRDAAGTIIKAVGDQEDVEPRLCSGVSPLFGIGLFSPGLVNREKLKHLWLLTI